MSNANLLKHHFLMSMPSLESDYFSNSLIYLCEHSEEGAMGIVVNKPHDIPMDEILEQLELPENSPLNYQPVYQGGPVSEEHGFILHRQGEQAWKSSLHLPEQLTLTTSLDVLEAISRGEGPEHYLFALGYAGWGPGQLDEEMSQNLWLSSPANLDILFDVEPEFRLSSAASTLGVDLNLISAKAGHA